MSENIKELSDNNFDEFDTVVDESNSILSNEFEESLKNINKQERLDGKTFNIQKY